MKTTIKTIIVILAGVGLFYLLNSAITKTDYQACKEYVDQALTTPNWFISEHDYEMCKFYGMDFSEYLYDPLTVR